MPVQNSIPKLPEGIPARASFAQERIWFLEQLGPGAFYNQLNGARIRGKLDPAALEKSILQIMGRHKVLSSSLRFVDGQLLQIASQEAFSINFIEVEGETSEARMQEAEALALADAIKPFDLSRGPMIRVKVFKLDNEDHLLAIFTHHSAFDGWSIHIFLEELAALYEINSSHSSSSVPPPPISYADYAFWQRSAYEGGVYDRQYEYWRKKLAGKLPVLDLPTDRPRPSALDYEAGIHRVMIPPELVTSLKALGRREGATLFMVLLSAFYALLQRYSNQDDLIVGCPIAGRNMRELEDLIGIFVNTLAIRADLSGNPDFISLLSRVRGATLEAYSNQDAQFDRLVEDLKPERDLGRNPIFQAVFQLRNYPKAVIESASLQMEPYDFPYATAKFDLTLDATETDDGLLCQFTYPVTLFEAATIQRMAEHWKNLLEAIVTDPYMGISEFSMLGFEERQQLLVGWNNTRSDYPREKTVHQVFEEVVGKHPSSVAVVHGDRIISYAQLNGRANQLASYLRSRGIKAGELVGVSMERSPEMLICFLAILKAGGAYLPIDPTDPRDRITFIAHDSKAKMILAMEKDMEFLPQGQVTVLCYDRLAEELNRQSDVNLPPVVGPLDLAYVIYTSGSTGRPKGVSVPHRAINRLVIGTNYVDITPNDVVAHESNPTFDMATGEIWGGLLNGARVVIVDRSTVLSPKDFVLFLREKGVTVLNITTPLFNLMAREDPTSFRTIKTLIFGGDVADPVAVGKVWSSAPPQRLINIYGPTENTTYSTWYLIKDLPQETTSIPIGIPVSNTTAYILDTNLQPVPIGLTGELFLGGDGLALGYHGQPDLTKTVFIDNPFDLGSKIYRTGDLVRHRADGNIEFLGRQDFQVKIRGFRVELGEVEIALLTHPLIRAAAVATYSDPESKEQWLSAYVVSSRECATNDAQLRDYLRTKLPEYMIPRAFVFLKELPLTSGGKIDRKSLPMPTKGPLVHPNVAVQSLDPFETRLKTLWEGVLGCAPIGIDDNFFDLGGHSLIAVRLFSKIESEFAVKLPLATLFQAQTVEEMAKVLKSKGSNKMWDSLVPLEVEGRGSPLFLIHAADGGLLNYYELVRNYGKERPIYGIQALGLNGETAPLTSIEAMASGYLNAIRTVQPRGPYLLLGYCAGGLVAYEMARQLKEVGDEVSLLGIIDSSAPGQKRSALVLRNEFMVEFLNLFVNIRSADPKENLINLIRYFPLRAMKVIQFGLHALGFGTRSQEPTLPYWASDLSDARKLTVLAITKAVRAYHPGKYSGTITLFRQTHPILTTPDPLLGWENLTKGKVDCMALGGFVHGSLLRPPQVRTLARELRRRIDIVEKKS